MPILIYVFLYAPIALIVAGSASMPHCSAMIWQGFSLEWYGKCLFQSS